MKQILYGVGKSLLKKYTDPTKVLALSNLKDVTVSMSGEEEEITGGDGLYPIAYFPTGKSITVSATNATFDIKFLEFSQNALVTEGTATMTEIFDYEIPADGVIKLDYVPKAGTLVVDGYTEAALAEPVAGEYDLSEDTLTFNVADAGKSIVGFCERDTGAETTTMSGLKDGLAQTAMFIHRIPVYDDNTEVVGQAQLTIFKCKADGNFEFNLAEKTAFAPQITLRALDPKRPDKKLWDFIVERL